jgi:hypothetical protein
VSSPANLLLALDDDSAFFDAILKLVGSCFTSYLLYLLEYRKKLVETTTLFSVAFNR